MTTLTVAPPTVRPANRIALQITGRDYVSYSQLMLMRTCPRKFRFEYIERAPKDFLPVSLLFGGSIHHAIEIYFRGRLEGLTLSAGDLEAAYEGAWQRMVEIAGPRVPVKFGAKEDASGVHALARRTLAAFLASPLANPQGIVVGVEEEVRTVLHPDLPDLVAKVDLLISGTDALDVLDFKTSRSRWTPERAQESGGQLVLYAGAMAGTGAGLGLPVRLAFAVLTKAKEPVVQVLPVSADPARVEAVTVAARQTWSAIVAGNFYPNPNPMNCGTCPFKSRCPAFGA